MKSLVLILAASVSAAMVPGAGAVNLTAALAAAQASDPTLASAVANRDAAEENIAIARAKLLPQLNLQASVQELNQSTNRSGVISEFGGPTRNQSLSLRQAIYKPRDFAGLDIGKLQAEYGAYKLVSTQSDLWNRTVAAWTEVLVAQSLRDVFQRAQEAVAASSEQEKRRFEAGDSTRDAVAEAAAQLALARAQLVEAKLDLQARLQAFNLLTRLWVPSFERFRLPSAVSLDPLPESEETFMTRVMDGNGDIAMARANEYISERRLAQNSADHKPTLDLVGSMNHATNDSTNTLGIRYRNSQLGLQLSVPILAGGGVLASERQATASWTAARADREAAIQKIKTQFVIDWTAQRSQRERADAALELVRAAQEQRRAAEYSIKAGVKTWAELGAAHLQLARREGDYVNYVGALIKTQARLLSLLPADDPAWGRWVTVVSSQAAN